MPSAKRSAEKAESTPEEEPVERPEDREPVEDIIARELSVANRGYVVDPNHRPRLTDRVGSFRTDNAGRADYSMADLAPVFDVADRRSLLTAARAIDPRDTGVDDAHITMAAGSAPADAVQERVLDKLEPEIEHLTTADELSVATNRRSSIQPPPPRRGAAEEPEGELQPGDETGSSDEPGE